MMMFLHLQSIENGYSMRLLMFTAWLKKNSYREEKKKREEMKQALKVIFR